MPAAVNNGNANANANAADNVNQTNNSNSARGDMSLDEDVGNINTKKKYKLPLSEAMMRMITDRTEVVEGLLRGKIDGVRGDNEELKNANEIIGKARNARKDATESKATKMPEEVKDFFKENDIPWSDKDKKDELPEELKGNEWDLSIENLNGWTESLTSNSQLNMTEIQSLTGKYNQSFEMLTQFISKYYRGGDSIIRNIN